MFNLRKEEMDMEHIIIFNNITTYISFFVNIAFLIPLTRKIFIYFTDKRYIKKVLGFNNEAVQITHGVFHLETDIGIKNDFITYSSLKSVDNVIGLLAQAGKEFDLLEKELNYKNEINIGGFMVNKKVNAYFSKYFPNFKYVTDISYKEKYESYLLDTRIVEYSCDKFGFNINNQKFLEIKYGYKDYAFLIKLVELDFRNESKKAVHILFGAGDKATYLATEYLRFNYKELYKEIHKKYDDNHYFFALEVNLVDESINSAKKIIDLTPYMFN